MSLGNWSPVRSRWRCSRLGWCARGRQFRQLPAETRFACCRPDSSQLLMGHREQPIFAIVPNLVLVQLLGQFLELLLPSSRSRNVAILVHFIRYTEFMLKVCYSDWLLLVLCGLHGLLQRCVHHADEVSRQIRPSSPARALFFPNQWGIKVFGSTNRTRNLVSTILRRAVNC